MEISNKFLAIVLIAAMIVSVGGTFLSVNRLNKVVGYTGAVTATGTSNLTINGSVAITMVISNVDFGVGYTNDSSPSGVENCTISTNSTNTPLTSGTSAVNVLQYPGQACVGFQQPASPFVVRNDGNVNASLNISVDLNATGLIGGTNPKFMVAAINNGTNACASGALPANWTDLTTSSIVVCPSTNFRNLDGNDTIKFHVLVNVPQDATTGTRASTLTATALNP